MDSTCWPAQTAWMTRRENEMAESEPLHITRSEKGWQNKSGEWAQTKYQVNSKKMKTRRRTWSWAGWRGGLWTITPRNRARGHSTYGATIIPRTYLGLTLMPECPRPCSPSHYCHPEQSVSIQGTTNIWSISALNPSCPPGTHLKLYLYWSYCQALL